MQCIHKLAAAPLLVPIHVLLLGLLLELEHWGNAKLRGVGEGRGVHELCDVGGMSASDADKLQSHFDTCVG